MDQLKEITGLQWRIQGEVFMLDWCEQAEPDTVIHHGTL